MPEKDIVKKILIILITAFFAFNATAQIQSEKKKVKGGTYTKQKDNLDELDLTTAQRSQLKIISKGIQARKQEIKSSKTLSQNEKEAQLEVLAGEEKTRTYQVLTMEQKNKLASKNPAYRKKVSRSRSKNEP